MKKTKNLRKMLALVLTLAMLASVCMVSAFAQSATVTALTLGNIATIKAGLASGAYTIQANDGVTVTDTMVTNIYDIPDADPSKTNGLTVEDLKKLNSYNDLYVSKDYESGTVTEADSKTQIAIKDREKGKYNDLYFAATTEDLTVNHLTNTNEAKAKLETNVTYVVTIPLLIDFGTQSKSVTTNAWATKGFDVTTSNLSINPQDSIELKVAPSAEGVTAFKLKNTATGHEVPWAIYAGKDLEEPANTAYEKTNTLLQYAAAASTANITETAYYNDGTTYATEILNAEGPNATDYTAVKDAGLTRHFTGVLDRHNIGPAGEYTQLLTFTLSYNENTTPVEG